MSPEIDFWEAASPEEREAAIRLQAGRIIGAAIGAQVRELREACKRENDRLNAAAIPSRSRPRNAGNRLDKTSEHSLVLWNRTAGSHPEQPTAQPVGRPRWGLRSRKAASASAAGTESQRR